MIRKYVDLIIQYFSKIFLSVFQYKTKQVGSKDLKYFKNEVFHKLAVLYIVLALFPIFYGSYLFFKENNIIAGVLELLTYIVILILFLSKRINIRKKKNIFVMSIFLLGVMLLFAAGPNGAGLIVIFSTFGLAGCILSERQNIIFVFIGFFILVVVSILFYLGFLNNLEIYRYGESWYIVAISTQCMGTLFVLIINNLFNDLANQTQEIKKSAMTILESEKMYKLLFELSGVLIGYYSPKGIIMSYNIKAAEYMCGIPEDFIGKSIADVFPEAYANKYKKRITDALSSNNKMEYEDLIPFKIGEKWIFSTFNRITNLKGEAIGVQVASIDITDRKKAEEKLVYSSIHDYLTGLYNRRFFEEEYQRRIIKKEFPIALLLGDIDGFKVFNDLYGHAAGNIVLKSATTSMKEIVDSEDVLARIGGDEFAIIVSGKNESEIRQYLDKLEQISYRDIEYTIKDSPLTISWGYGIQRKNDDTIDMLNEQAEAYMYNRKFYSHKSARSKTVDVIMQTLFTKSDREKKHSERVGKLCEAIAKKMNLRKSQIDKIRVAGLLHDIGKIGIDESILNKAGKLDVKEWELMKLHSAKGASILESTVEYQDIADVVLSHHEHYDGTGYPRGLQGESIPLWSRIIAVADAFDAMTNVRSYRKAISNEEAILEIKKCSGTQFDKHIVDLLVDIINEHSPL